MRRERREEGRVKKNRSMKLLHKAAVERDQYDLQELNNAFTTNKWKRRAHNQC